MNSWPVLTIPTFFEILNATFPHLKYDENSNKIHGLKLVLNVKQQIQLKNQQQPPLPPPPPPPPPLPVAIAQKTILQNNDLNVDEEKILDNIETRINTIKQNGHSENNEKENFNATAAAKVSQIDDESSSSSTTSTLTQSSSSTSDNNNNNNNNDNVNIKKRRLSSNSNTNESCPKKKSLKVNETESVVVAPIEQYNTDHYLCEWDNCKRSFQTAKAVYNHVCRCHLLSDQRQVDKTVAQKTPMLCMWSYCDQIKRQKWSLVNHLQERHCNENALKTALRYRQQGLIPPFNQSTAHTPNGLINFSNNGALLAIQRHQRVKREDFLSPEEGPITKSIRLLSALTLRNLAKNSEKAKASIKQYETLLASVAFDLLESSNAIANCLWHLSH
jgi:hypothetical protein